MADPVLIDCPADIWTKVATNVTIGQIHRKSTKPNGYLQTYRLTGGTAPTDVEEGVPVFGGGSQAEISAAAAIDVYIQPMGSAGKVRTDL